MMPYDAVHLLGTRSPPEWDLVTEAGSSHHGILSTYCTTVLYVVRSDKHCAVAA